MVSTSVVVVIVVSTSVVVVLVKLTTYFGVPSELVH